MLELTTTQENAGEDDRVPLHPSPLMMDEKIIIPTQDVHSNSNDDSSGHGVHENDSDSGRDDYGADPLSMKKHSDPSPSPAISPSPSMEPPRQQSSNSRAIIKRKLLLLFPLLLCLYMLTDSDYYEYKNNRRHHHLAFITALSRHPPSLRVFRLVSEGAFVLFCTAFALWVWEDAGSNFKGKNGNASSSLPSSSYRDEILADGEVRLDQWENNPSKNIVGNTSSNTEVRMTPQAVGELLFAPPPNTITTNAAWEVYKKHRSFRRRKRQKKRSSSGSGNNTENGNQSIKLDGSDVCMLKETTTATTKNESDKQQINNESDEQTLSKTHPLPPLSSSVLGAALDISTLTCMFLIFFTISSAEGGRYIDPPHIQGTINNNTNNKYHQETWMKYIANIAAPLFPLTLFLLSIFLVLLPWHKRQPLWTILSLTIGAPFYEVTFRDGFIGDILTSTVRPLQDLAFTVFFTPLGVRAWWSRELYTMDAAAIPLERSWMLHTVVLPACTLSPLWWRFLQNLRQCYDAKQRWPYLGNAFKYLLTAEVAIFGVFDPSVKKSPVWITCFFIATLYQVWWDVFMDWGLLELDPSFGYYYHAGVSGNRGWFWWWPYSLRSQRLYRRTWVYYAIFGVNFCLRFVGMITLIPPVYLSRSTGLIVSTYNDPDFQLFVGSLVACAEIFRRTIWALLRLEWEVIKTSSEKRNEEIQSLESNGGNPHNFMDEENEMKPMAISSSERFGGKQWRGAWPFATPNEASLSLVSLSSMSMLNDIQILSELCVWATIFSGIAIIAAAHREVL